MLVYGDAEEFLEARAVTEEIAARIGICLNLPPGLERHASLVRAFVRLGQLLQGQADAEFAAAGMEEESPRLQLAARLLVELGRVVLRSWDSGFDCEPQLPDVWLASLQNLAGDTALRIRQPEGYAFYEVYPESYGEAARRSALPSDTLVIGIRSIGTGLAAMVSAALGAATPVTLRPIGHPFARQLRIGPLLTQRLLANTKAPFAVVDEGPGMSGSSFASVADWFAARGVDRSRVHFFPSHGGDCGNHATPENRARWVRASRHVVGFDQLSIEAEGPSHRLETWVGDRIGGLVRPLEDISGGAWRRLLCADESRWPPTDGQRERRKFLAHGKEKTWCIRFAGIGETGERKLRTARLLAEQGFCPNVAGLCHGFLIERWAEGMPLGAAGIERSDLVCRVGRYLGYRAAWLRAPTAGAAPAQLFAMAVANTEEAQGTEAADRLRELLGSPDKLDGLIRPVDTDNRLHLWEWLVTADGRLLKTDALDHSSGHDLIGCQDVAWDIIGAGIELDLGADERQELAAIVSATSGRKVCADLLAVLEPCYLAFQIGLWSQASENVSGLERERILAVVQNYSGRLLRTLS